MQLHELSPEAFLRALPGLIRPTIVTLLDEYRIVLGHRFTESEACNEQGSRYRGTFIVMALDSSTQCVIGCWQWINGPIPDHCESVEWQIRHSKGVVDGTVAEMTRDFRLELERKS